MKPINRVLMEETFDPEAHKYEEEWVVKINTGAEYTLGKDQARLLQQAIVSGSRGIILFKTFSISIPYISEFERLKRFLKEEYQLPDRAREEPYQPIPKDKWVEVSENLRGKYPYLQKLRKKDKEGKRA